MQLALENPLILDFRSTLQVNGKKLELTHGSGTAYAPWSGKVIHRRRSGRS